MTEPNDFFLKWNDFQRNISLSFSKLHGETDFSDVTLACDGNHQIQAHKIILAASSPIFKDLLRHSTHQNPIIFMRGIKAHVLSSILEFIYYGEVKICQDEVDSFIEISQDLLVKGIAGTKVGDDKDQTVHENELESIIQMNKTGTTTSVISEDPLENISTDLKIVGTQFLEEQNQTELFDKTVPYTIKGNRKILLSPALGENLKKESQTEILDRTNPNTYNGLIPLGIAYLEEQNKPDVLEETYHNKNVENIKTVLDSLEGKNIKHPKQTKIFEHETNNTVDYTELDNAIIALMERKENIYIQSTKYGHIEKMQWKCKMCDFVAAKSKVMTHVEGVHMKAGSHPCSLCGKICKTRRSLKEHCNMHLKSEPTSTLTSLPSCSKCGKNFVQFNHLKIHMKTHKNRDPKACSYCDKIFTLTHRRNSHEKAHTLPYSCSHCEMSFSRRKFLKDHARKHTGEKLYECPYCDKSFEFTNDSMKRHMEGHL